MLSCKPHCSLPPLQGLVRRRCIACIAKSEASAYMPADCLLTCRTSMQMSPLCTF